MTYKEYRNFLNTNKDFYLYKAVAVSEVDCFADTYDLLLTDDEFNKICSFVYEWITNSEASAKEVAELVCKGLSNKEIKMEDFDDYSDGGFLSKAEKWLNEQF